MSHPKYVLKPYRHRAQFWNLSWIILKATFISPVTIKTYTATAWNHNKFSLSTLNRGRADRKGRCSTSIRSPHCVCLSMANTWLVVIRLEWFMYGRHRIYINQTKDRLEMTVHKQTTSTQDSSAPSICTKTRAQSQISFLWSDLSPSSDLPQTWKLSKSLKSCPSKSSRQTREISRLQLN